MSAQDFSRKLTLAAETLGCGTMKELLARLLAANPATGFDLQRAYKWLQGRSTPRDPGVYQDLADVLGLAQGGEFVRTASFEAFAAAVRGVGAAAVDLAGGSALRHLDGRYCLYMPTFSRFPVPRILRCTTTIETGSDGATVLRVGVPRPGFLLWFRGRLEYAERAVVSLLRGEDHSIPMMFMFADPPPPVRVIAGLSVSTAAFIADIEPHCCRMLMIRTPPENAGLPADGNFFDFEEQAMVGELERLGYRDAGPAGLAPHVLDFLGALVDRPTISVPSEAVEHVAVAFERAGPPLPR